MPSRAALYLRVSTDKQSTANQRPEVEQLVRARGFEVVHAYEEQASAACSAHAFIHAATKAPKRRLRR